MSSSSGASLFPPRFRRNVASGYLTSVVSALILLLVTPVLVAGLGKGGYGLWVLLTSLAPYSSLLDLGLGSATVKYVAEYHGRDVDLTGRTISTSLSTLAILGVVVLLAGIPFSFIFPSLFNIEAGDRSTAVIAMLLFTFSAAISLPATTFEAALMGIQRYDITNLTFLMVLSAQGLAWGIIIFMGGGIIELSLATVAFETAGHLGRFVAMRRILRHVPVSFRSFDRRLAGRMMHLSGWIAIGEATTVVIHRIDPLVVGAVAGVPAVGIYSVGQRLAAGVDALIRPTLTGFFAHASRLSAKQDPNELRAAMLAGTRLSLAIAGPVCITVILLAHPAIHLWIGGGFSSSGSVALFLVSGMAVAAISRSGFLMLQGAGYQRVTAKLSAFEAALNLTLSITFGLTIGLIGVALATFVATAVTRLFLIIPYVCRSFRVPLTEFFAVVARAHVPPIGVTLLVGWVIERVDLASIPALVGAGVALVAVYVLTFVATGLRRDERKRLASAVRRSWSALSQRLG